MSTVSPRACSPAAVPVPAPSSTTPVPAFVAPRPLLQLQPAKSPPHPRHDAPLCVSRPDSAPNPLSAAVALVSTLLGFKSPSSPSTSSPASTALPSNASPQPHAPDVSQSSLLDADDGLEARLRARADVADADGLDTRLAAQKSRQQARARTPSSYRRRSPSFNFFAPRSEPPPRPVYPSAFSRIDLTTLIFILDDALRRRATSPTSPHLATLLPYDLQRLIFEQLVASPSDSVRESDAPFPAQEKTHNDPRPPANVWEATWRFAVHAFRIVTLQPRDSSDPAAAAAFTAAAIASDASADLDAAAIGGEGGNSAAAAYAAAAAIASSTAASAAASSARNSQQLDGLKAAVSAARAVAHADDATVFVDTVGVAPLVSAAHVLPGTDRAAAFTALANIAIVLPKARVAMLEAETGLIVQTIVDVVCRLNRFRVAQSAGGASLWYTEALVSSTHLLGSLALARGAAGREFRRKMATSTELVRRLERIAGGLKNGEAEGAARAARRALGALGINRWKPKVPGQKGLRILSIDGGGTRAIMAFETVSLSYTLPILPTSFFSSCFVSRGFPGVTRALFTLLCR